jgi:hypothetical protein
MEPVGKQQDAKFGTLLDFIRSTETTTAMKPNMERARKLMDTATRMMMEGNVERYLHALRLLMAMRCRTVVTA